jgi:two-component system, NarL family, sensor histidine kinase UhpB
LAKRFHRFAFLRSGRLPARVYAISIVLGVLTPALALAAYLAIESARSARAHLEQSARDETREAIAAIERDVVSVQNTLIALASSPSLQNGDFEAFYRQAADVSRRIGLQIVLHDPQLNQLANTAVPWKSTRTPETPTAARDAYSRLVETGKPAVSDVFFAPLAKRYSVAVMVPVFRGDHLTFAVAAGLPAKRFSNVLKSLHIHPDQTVSVIDRNGIFVTRSLNDDGYIGTHTLQSFPAEVPRVYRGVNRNGVPFHAFNDSSALLGWRISTNMPDRVLNAPMYQALGTLAGGGSILIFVAIALVHFLERRILRTVGTLGIDREPTIEEFAILFDSAPNGVMVVDDRGRIVLLNARMEEKFGYLHRELVGEPVEILVPEQFRRTHLVLRENFVRAPLSRPMGAGRDLYGRRKDGTEFPVEIGLNPIKSHNAGLVMITVVDISARKLAAEQLDAARVERDVLQRRFIAAQEQERLRLAHELHDQTGQNLAAVTLEIKSIEGAVDERIRPRFRLLRRLLEQMGQTLHQVAWELRPASIDELGLSIALANYLAEWGEQCGMSTDFHCDQTQVSGLSDEVCTVIYRVTQEALTNVVKHARGATSVSVVLETANAQVRLTIEDNGCGFDADAASGLGSSRVGGLGIAGMRERLTLIGAELEIESSIGSGTTIFARIPAAPVTARAVA